MSVRPRLVFGDLNQSELWSDGLQVKEVVRIEYYEVTVHAVDTTCNRTARMSCSRCSRCREAPLKGCVTNAHVMLVPEVEDKVMRKDAMRRDTSSQQKSEGHK